MREGKPVLIDLFCGAGGCTKGYQRAGFYVIGVDLTASPRYCGDEFYEADALTFDLGRADAVHASPPCQAYAGSTAWRGSRGNHPRLIGPVRERLRAAGAPYVIENVPDARRELVHPLLLCGSGLGLPIRRHRYFETSWPWATMVFPCCHRPTDYAFDHGGKQTESAYRNAMGCGWMTVGESREAIPPAYTELIGHQLMAHVRVPAV